MEKWKKYSDDPLERVKIVSVRDSSRVKCLNCGRILKSEFKLWDDGSGAHRCRCGYFNYFVLIGEYLWEVRLIKIPPEKE
jgi:hypothetical protein